VSVKLPAYRAGLPGKVISFYIVPLDPAYPDRSGRGTVRPDVNQVSKIFGIILNTDTENACLPAGRDTDTSF